MMKWIERLLILFIFLIPWQARWVIRAGQIGSPSTSSGNNFWEYGTTALYATDLLFLLIVILCVVWGFQRKEGAVISNFQFLISKQTPSPRFQIAYCLPLTAYVLASIFWSLDKPVAFYSALKLFEGVALFLIVRTVQSYEVEPHKMGGSTSIISWAFVASAVVQSVLAIAQFFTQSVFSWPFSGIALQDPSDLGVSVVQFADERWLRAYGSFPHPNMLGSFLAIALLLLLQQLTSCNTKHVTRNRLRFCYMLYVTCYIIIASGLFFTFSRAAWVAFFIGLIIYAVQTKAWREKIFLQLTLLLVVIASVLTILFFPLVRTRIGGGERLEIQSNQERTTGYREAVQLIRRHPFFGVGIGNYTAAVAREFRSNDPAWSYQPVHNVFLLILSELGLVGVILFLFHLTLSLSSKERGGRVTRYSLLVPLVILAMLDHSLWTLHSGILILWGSIALLDLNITRSDLQREDRPRSLPPVL